MDHLGCINAFIEIVEQGSLHKAANRLCQTDAAISKKLKKLEEFLKTDLIIRNRNGINLTSIGKDYYNACKDVIDKFAIAHSVIQHAKVILHGELHISCNRYIYNQYISPKLSAFINLYPEILLDINIAENVSDFLAGKTDILFGVTLEFNEYNELVRKPLGVTRRIICASPKYLGSRAIKRPNELKEFSYICHSQQINFNTIVLDSKEVTLQPYLKFDDTDVILDAALQGLGFITVKEFTVQDYLQSGQLVEILPQYNKASLPLYIYYKYQTHINPKIRAFLDFFAHRYNNS